MNHLDVYDPLMVTFSLFLPVLNHPLPLELFVCLRLIIGILSLLTFAHLTLLSLFNPALNLTFSLLPITSSHPHASASDSTFDYWRYINIWLTLTLTCDRLSTMPRVLIPTKLSQEDLADKTSWSADCIWYDSSIAFAQRYNFHHTTTVPTYDFT